MSIEAKRRYIGMINTECKKHGLTLNDYKRDPILLFEKSASFRNYVTTRFKYDSDFTWWGKAYNWKTAIEAHPTLKTTVKTDYNHWVTNAKKQKTIDKEINDDDLNGELILLY